MLNALPNHRESTLNSEKVYQKQAESLKAKLKDYNTETFGNSPTIQINSGQEIGVCTTMVTERFRVR